MNSRDCKKFILLVFFLPFASAFGQNLVPNPSFEQGPDQCGFTRLPELFILPHWTLPTPGTSDIFSTQISNTICWAYAPKSTTTNAFSPSIGHQFPRSGNRFAGIISMELAKPDSKYREYLQVKLSQTLEVGKSYCAEMYVSLAEQPKYASNNLGFYFTTEQILQKETGYFIDGKPQVHEPRVITDSVAWTRVAGLFTADSSYQYLTIGAFFNYDETKVLDKGGSVPGSWSFNTSYYFLDDIAVEKHDGQKFAGDTLICQGETANIEALVKWDSLHWTTLSHPSLRIGDKARLSITPQTTTRYLVKGKVCNSWTADTITVHVKPAPVLNLGTDTVLCVGDFLTLRAQTGFQRYQWNDGSTDEVLTVSQSGVYEVICKSDNGCETSDQVHVSFIEPPTISLGSDTVACQFYPLNVKGSLDGNLEFEWSTGSKESVITPDEKGTYWVTVTNQCGFARDTVVVEAFDDIFVPNVVTPNGDGLNDRLQISGWETDFSPALSVFNSWGLEVYSNPSYSSEWPTNDTSPGVYFYSVSHAKCRSKKGWIHVIK
jgi:hypothetical protein